VLTVAFATAWLAADAWRSDGPVVGWGPNLYGQATPPASVDGTMTGTASAIAAGDYYTLAIAAPEPGELLLGFAALGALALMRRHRFTSMPAPRA